MIIKPCIHYHSTAQHSTAQHSMGLLRVCFSLSQSRVICEPQEYLKKYLDQECYECIVQQKCSWHWLAGLRFPEVTGRGLKLKTGLATMLLHPFQWYLGRWGLIHECLYQWGPCLLYLMALGPQLLHDTTKMERGRKQSQTGSSMRSLLSGFQIIPQRVSILNQMSFLRN